MKHQFLYNSLIPKSRKISLLIFIIVLAIYMYFSNLLNIGTIIFLCILALGSYFLHLLNHKICIDIPKGTLSKKLYFYNWTISEAFKINISEVNFIYLNQANYTMRMQSHGGQTNTTSGVDFNAYMKLKNEHKIHLDKWTKKEFCLDEMNKIAQLIEVAFLDNTKS